MASATGIINGTRVVERFDLTVRRSFNPNNKLNIVNAPQPVTGRQEASPSAQKKIAAFVPENLKKMSKKVRFEQARVRQRKAVVEEVTFEVQKKINRFKQLTLGNSRFSKDVGKGSILDVSG